MAPSGPELILPLLQLLVHGLERGFVLRQHRWLPLFSPHPPLAMGNVGRLSLPQPCPLPSQNRSGCSGQSAAAGARCRRRTRGWPPSPGGGGEEARVSTGPPSPAAPALGRQRGFMAWGEEHSCQRTPPGLCQGHGERIPEEPTSLLSVERTWRPSEGSGQSQRGHQPGNQSFELEDHRVNGPPPHGRRPWEARNSLCQPPCRLCTHETGSPSWTWIQSRARAHAEAGNTTPRGPGGGPAHLVLDHPLDEASVIGLIRSPRQVRHLALWGTEARLSSRWPAASPLPAQPGRSSLKSEMSVTKK